MSGSPASWLICAKMRSSWIGCRTIQDGAPPRALPTPAAINGIVKLAEIWRLTSAEACALLGDVSERTWFRMKKGKRTGDLSQDALTRISALIGIFKGLRLLFSEPLCDEWIRLPNKGPVYGGRRPGAPIQAR